jgi:hypothetical protein
VPYCSSALKAPVFPPRRRGERMSGWYPDWQTTIAWLVVTAMAGVIYFGPMTRVIEFGN